MEAGGTVTVEDFTGDEDPGGAVTEYGGGGSTGAEGVAMVVLGVAIDSAGTTVAATSGGSLSALLYPTEISGSGAGGAVLFGEKFGSAPGLPVRGSYT